MCTGLWMSVSVWWPWVRERMDRLACNVSLQTKIQRDPLRLRAPPPTPLALRWPGVNRALTPKRHGISSGRHGSGHGMGVPLFAAVHTQPTGSATNCRYRGDELQLLSRNGPTLLLFQSMLAIFGLRRRPSAGHSTASGVQNTLTQRCRHSRFERVLQLCTRSIRLLHGSRQHLHITLS